MKKLLFFLLSLIILVACGDKSKDKHQALLRNQQLMKR